MGDVEKALRKAINDGMKDVESDGQTRLDRVARRYGERSKAEIESALRREFSGTPINPSRLQLQEWSTLISSGRQIRFRAEKI